MIVGGHHGLLDEHVQNLGGFDPWLMIGIRILKADGDEVRRLEKAVISRNAK